ncbi:MAG: hypothetical protein JST16_07430 [Bdellovibrionales bacterium]|nr:hypothetical protein [Bdellovibrionales bacterium]
MLNSSRRGQAMVEFLPAVMIFILIMSAGLAYFRVMRAASLRQEAARNLAFAKIDNAGTLTTIDSPDAGRSAAAVAINIEGVAIPAMNDQSNPFVGRDAQCFSVIPGGQAQKKLDITYRYGASSDTPVTISTYAVVCRK